MLYYENGLTQKQIGRRLRLSRQKVQRQLLRARKEGIVHTVVRPRKGMCYDLERSLEERYGLREAVVIETMAYKNQAAIAAELGAAASEYLHRVIRSQDRIVIGWGGTLLETVDSCCHFRKPDVRNVVIIQGLGGLVDPNHDAHASELTRRLAEHLHGQALLLPAPGVAGTPQAQRAFHNDPYVKKVLETGRRATLALVSIGAPRRDSLLVREGKIVSWGELAGLIKQGAVGDIGLRYFDQEGRPVSSKLDTCVIGLSLQDFQDIGHVVGVAGGAAKLKAVQGAVRGKWINVLITDNETAKQLLN